MSWDQISSHLQGILLILSIVIFWAIAGWAYSPKSKKNMDDSAQIPMRDDR